MNPNVDVDDDDEEADEGPIINPVHDVLIVCGITVAANRNVFINIEGLDTLDKFAYLDGDRDVTEMAKRMLNRASAAAGKVMLGTIQIKNLQSLVWWCKDHHRRGKVLDPANWSKAELSRAAESKETELSASKIDVDFIDPGKCQTDHGWDNWQIAFLNKLSATNGAAGVPVDYVVRPELDFDDELFDYDDDEQRRLYEMPLTGTNYKHDNRLVYGMLKAACIRTDAWIWIQTCDTTYNGRKAWLALVEHYDGDSELGKRVHRAKHEIEDLHYKDERVLPFDRYATKMKEAFYVLNKDKDEKMSEKRQVQAILNGITSQDPAIVAAKTNVFKDYNSDIDKAIAFLSSLISSVHAAAKSAILTASRTSAVM